MRKILLLIIPLFFFACGDKDNTPPKELLGGWKMEYNICNGEKQNVDENYIIVFTGNWYVKQLPHIQERGVPFSLNGNTLEWEVKRENEVVKYKYNYSLKGDTLILKDMVTDSSFTQCTSYYSKNH